jgi:hypothetical protein
MPKHTPGPLIVLDPRDWNNGTLNLIGRDGYSEVIATTHNYVESDDTHEAEANAAEIVRRWNAHEQLVEALQDVEQAWTGNGDMSAAVDAALLALAAAEGGE